MSTELQVHRPYAALMDMQTWQMLREQCNVLVKSGFTPKGCDTPEKALAIAMKGAELGLSPMAAYGGMSVVNGKIVIEGQLMLALILRIPGAKVEFLERTEKICRVRALRPGIEWHEFTWTIEQARHAKLTEKPGPWQQYPRNMLQWRAVSDMGKALFADVLAGTYTPDEAEHIDVEARVVTRTERAQELLAAQDAPPDEQEKPKDNVPEQSVDTVAEPIQKADPMLVAKLVTDFHKIGIPTEDLLAGLFLKSAEQITTKDYNTLKDRYKVETAKMKKEEGKK